MFLCTSVYRLPTRVYWQAAASSGRSLTRFLGVIIYHVFRRRPLLDLNCPQPRSQSMVRVTKAEILPTAARHPPKGVNTSVMFHEVNNKCITISHVEVKHKEAFAGFFLKSFFRREGHQRNWTTWSDIVDTSRERARMRRADTETINHQQKPPVIDSW